ncbi:nitroreductase [Neglecta sp. X4]|jgi:nitroreductase|uniref:nitroreductase family protein n=1 Tax=unclassified Neglectibacter TaxID=2632164 RepID=UPI00136AD0AB|nr:MULTISPECIES: nitroreductase family protein [unclassified Neglectibacter]NBI17497.1 nitroreductase [Neglectibacter sp. 59]NBJ73046.1 nitroreductase [Neglectibacter sp. X4]NCE80933.1 nitroreductase [Neglectibacter sp. X58]
MDFLELAADRYSVRSYSDRPIEPEKMERILKAGQLAPTAVNFQPQKIYVLKSPEAIGKIRSLTRFAYDAPVVLLVCADKTKVWRSPSEHGYDTGEMDASIVCTHMMLEAWALGIGSVWVRGFDSRQVAKVFDLPEQVQPICLLPIGYPSDESVPYEEWHSTFRPLSETVEER